MANAYTDTSAIAGLVKTAYDRYVEFALRSQPLIRSVADKRPAQQAMPGSSVVFSIYNDLAAATSALTETTDPDSVALSDVSTTSVTLNEYGNTALKTRKLDLTSFSDVDPAVADIVAFNMADSLDQVAMATLRAGSNVLYGGAATSTGTVSAAGVITSALIRKAVAKLRAGKAVPRAGSLYWVGIHPEVSHDLRAETGSVGWRDVHATDSTNAGNIFAGTIGTYEGAFFVETPRMYNATDGATSARNYRTILCGKQALAEAVAQEPGVVIGPVTDKLNRFRPIGWYGVLGFARYREAALYRIETGSSIA